jgi:glycosyltransferase involved in cell wall biosynthesis
MNKIQTLLIYSTLPIIGGNSTNTLTVAKEFRKLGWKVLVLTRHQAAHGLSGENIELLRKMGCEVRILTTHNGNYGFATLKALIWVFLRGKGAVFVTLCMGSVSPVLSFIGRFRKSIFYLITHEENENTLSFLIRSKRLFTDIAVVSPITSRPLKKLLGEEKNVTWLPQFSDFGSGNRPLADKKKDRNLTFGFLGTLSSGKGIHLLIESWPKLKERADLRIAGDGPMRARVEEAVVSSQVGGKSIYYAGAFNAAGREEFLGSFFNSIDYLIAPSVNTMEGIPTVILEALSYGVPVLASNLGGTACFGLEWLKPQYQDVVHLFNLEKLDETISYFIAKGLPAKEYQSACIDYYKTWFSNEAVLKRWVEITS